MEKRLHASDLLYRYNLKLHRRTPARSIMPTYGRWQGDGFLPDLFVTSLPYCDMMYPFGNYSSALCLQHCRQAHSNTYKPGSRILPM